MYGPHSAEKISKGDPARVNEEQYSLIIRESLQVFSGSKRTGDSGE